MSAAISWRTSATVNNTTIASANMRDQRMEAELSLLRRDVENFADWVHGDECLSTDTLIGDEDIGAKQGNN